MYVRLRAGLIFTKSRLAVSAYSVIACKKQVRNTIKFKEVPTKSEQTSSKHVFKKYSL